jgi:hypothetical protein
MKKKKSGHYLEHSNFLVLLFGDLTVCLSLTLSKNVNRRAFKFLMREIFLVLKTLTMNAERKRIEFAINEKDEKAKLCLETLYRLS